jgi:hypothetical protein
MGSGKMFLHSCSLILSYGWASMRRLLVMAGIVPSSQQTFQK